MPLTDKQIKKLLADEEWTDKWIDNYILNTEKKDNAVIAYCFPKHKKHSLKEIDKEYLGAIFFSKTFQCSCGKKLILKREMYDNND